MKKDFQNYYLYSKQIIILPDIAKDKQNYLVLEKYRELKTLQITGLRETFKNYRTNFEVGMKKASGTLNILTILMVINIAAGILFSLIVQILLLSSVIRPLTKLFSAVKAINSGNLEIKADIHSHDEIGELAVNFNIMTEKLHTSFAQITHQKEEIQETNQKLENEIVQKEIILRELWHLKNYLNNIIESMPSALITLDRTGKITLWNQAAKTLTGYSRDDVKGKNIREITDLFDPYMETIQDSLKLRRPAFFPRQFLKNSDTALKNINIYPLVANGVEGCVIRTDDISEIEKIEEQLRQIQKMETIGSLAGGLAHDFNNVLGGIIGLISLLRYQAEQDEFISKETLILDLDEIDKLCERAHQMINQLLTLSRKHEYILIPLNLNESINNVIKICKNTFDKVVNIQYSEPDFKPMINADPTQIEQVLLNLCVNSYHSMTFMRPDNTIIGGTLELHLEQIQADFIFCTNHPEAKEIKYWRLSVIDNGIGMNKNILSKIFEPFFTTKSKEKGTGLGLSMVYNIIQQHNGFLDIYSEEGIGTSINIYFPALLEKEQKLLSPTSNTIHKGKGLILIIDDEDIIRRTARDMLTVCGYKVLTAPDGKTGREIFQEQWKEIDLVILDLIMPEKSGDQIFLAFKEINPAVRVLLASGFRKDQRVENALAAGVIAFMQKPYTIEVLSKSVAAALAHPTVSE